MGRHTARRPRGALRDGDEGARGRARAVGAAAARSPPAHAASGEAELSIGRNRFPSAASREAVREGPFHAARETWGVLTPGTDLGNAHFTIAAARGALQLLRFRCRPVLGHLLHGLHDLFWVVRFLHGYPPSRVMSRRSAGKPAAWGRRTDPPKLGTSGPKCVGAPLHRRVRGPGRGASGFGGDASFSARLITRRRLSGFPFSVSTAVGVPLRLPCDDFDGESKYSGQKVEAARSRAFGSAGNPSQRARLRRYVAKPADAWRLRHQGYLIRERHRPDEARLKGERLGPHRGHRSWNLSPAL